MSVKIKYSLQHTLYAACFLIGCAGCDNYFKNDYQDNSPTSGHLKVYYDEGLRPHVVNQKVTFESQYHNSEIQLHESNEGESVKALYNDSCEAIIISRQLTQEETRAFISKKYNPKFTKVALSGVAIIVNSKSTLKTLSYESIVELLKIGGPVKDSIGNSVNCTVLFDKNNSSVLHYMMDSVCKTNKLSPICNILGSTLETINYVANNENTLGFIDYAWLSDIDDSLFKANSKKIKFIAINKPGSNQYEFPNQSSFKVNTYPFTRSIYVMRKTGEFSLAKGFETYIAGPKGQLTFLKQGLMPARQNSRDIHINMEGSNSSTNP